MGYTMGLVGRKLGMTQVFTEDGVRIPVTVLEVGPCVVLEKRTPDKHGYSALQLGFGEQSPHRVSKPVAGQFAKKGSTPKRVVREIRIPASELDRYEVGQEITLAEVFQEGTLVDVTGTSKGRGFQGVMKRYGFSGFRASHGTHEYFRHGGSIGCRLTPGRTVKGKRMPGHMGGEQVTVQNLTVVGVRPDDHVLLVKGAVPGPNRGFVVVRQAVKKLARDATKAEKTSG